MDSISMTLGVAVALATTMTLARFVFGAIFETLAIVGGVLIIVFCKPLFGYLTRNQLPRWGATSRRFRDRYPNPFWVALVGVGWLLFGLCALVSDVIRLL